MQASIYVAGLKRIIGARKAFVSVKSSRPAQEYIRLRFSKEFKTVEATAIDGYRLSVEHAACGDIDEDFTAYIKPTIPASKKTDMAVIEVRDGFCYIRINDNVTGYRQPQGEFVDGHTAVEQTTQKPHEFRIGFNGNFLLSALQAAQISCGNSFKQPVIMEFRGQNDAVIIRTNKDDIKFVLPVRIKGGE
jgi:DNA polymerase III sliding clamp (beta) subunit (PCNA family)